MTIRIYKSCLIQWHKWAGFGADRDLVNLIVTLGFCTLWLSHNNIMNRLLVKSVRVPFEGKVK